MAVDSRISGVRRADIRVLPARVAYLVSSGDRAAYLRAVAEASTRWAGATELILPISDRGIEPYDQLIELMKIDGLVDVGLDEGVVRQIGLDIGLPTVPLDQLANHMPLRCAPRPFDVEYGTDLTEYPPVVAAPDSDLWIATAAGAFSPSDWQWLRENSGRVSDLATLPWGLPQLGLAQLSGTTWLDRTLRGFTETFGSGVGGNLPLVLWVTGGLSLDDCIGFWNLRARRPLAFGSMPIALLPVNAFEDWTTLQQQVVGSLRRASAPTPDVLLTSLSVPSERLRAIAERLVSSRLKTIPAFGSASVLMAPGRIENRPTVIG